MQEILHQALGAAVFILMLAVGMDCTSSGFRRSAVVILTVLADPREIGRQLKALVVPVLVITPCLFALGFAVARAIGTDAGDRRAILFELPCRNVALAMLIALSVLGRPELAFMAMAFFMLETVLLLLLAGLLTRVPDGSRGNCVDHGNP